MSLVTKRKILSLEHYYCAVFKRDQILVISSPQYRADLSIMNSANYQHGIPGCEHSLFIAAAHEPVNP